MIDQNWRGCKTGLEGTNKKHGKEYIIVVASFDKGILKKLLTVQISHYITYPSSSPSGPYLIYEQSKA